MQQRRCSTKKLSATLALSICSVMAQNLPFSISLFSSRFPKVLLLILATSAVMLSCTSKKTGKQVYFVHCSTSQFIWQHLHGDLEGLRMPYNEAVDPMALGWYAPVQEAVLEGAQSQLVLESDQDGWMVLSTFATANPDSVAGSWLAPLSDCLKANIEKVDIDDGSEYWQLRQGTKVMELQPEFASQSITIRFFMTNGESP